MNILEEVLKEHSRAMRARIVRYVGNDPKRFKVLVNVYLGGPYRVTQRAAWPLSYCVQQHPELVKPHLKKLIQYSKAEGSIDAVKRNTIRLLQFIDIPKSLQGEVADMCFGLVADPKEPIAARAFSITVLANLVKHEPELKNELKIILEDQMPYFSSALKNRANRILRAN